MKVGLVLGGGGARGLAHIGVLKALAEREIEVVAASGCSMGAIIAAFFASGHSPEAMQAISKALKFSQFLQLGELGGIISGQGLEAVLKEHLPQDFSDLAFPISMTTVDVQEGSLVILRSGELVPALKATSALPGILSPVKHRGRYLIDGGLLNNVPVDIIRGMTLEPIIAVDVSAPPDRKLEFEPDKVTLFQNLAAIIRGKKNPFGDLLSRSLTIELFMKAFDIPQKVLTEMRLSLQPPDLLIRPKLDERFGIEDFSLIDEAIELGYEAATSVLDSWLESASLAKAEPA